MLRPNSTSYVALARAQWLTNRKDDARGSIDKALAMPVRSVKLFETAAMIYESDAAKAKDFREKAVLRAR